ncbi:uncharacterized protein IL334_007387 [Kwoniella shivajii]|uniref:Alpha/beta hydrolase fold-3 domain-containing protein n=1 Tax=Kwoniella shivajii TaxID=564305 RepID=A0ABZ1D8I4_9TREE|nr:hypothetical protein IL334_007387 [Kwoniella shivajii]
MTSGYIRSTPNPDAPNAPSRFVYSPISFFAYVLYLLLIPLYVPYLVLVHCSTSRPFPSWTLDRRISTRLGKLQATLLGYWIVPILEDEWSIQPYETYTEAQRKDEILLEVVSLKPVNKECIKGIADVNGVESVKRPGFWITPNGAKGRGGAERTQGEKVILHVHGGGYIRGHPLWTPFPMEIAKATKLRCLSVNYRKTLDGKSSFPAPLLDILSAYIYLTETLHFHSGSIIVLGESAGGHLLLFLSQYLRDLGLSQPGCFILSSPWVDFTLPNTNSSYTLNSSFDQLSPLRLGRAIKSATRYYTDEFKVSSYASPCKMTTGGWNYLAKSETKIYVHYGGRELFHDEIVTLGKSMKSDQVELTVRLDPDGLHTSGMNGPAGEIFKKDLLEMLSK